MLALLIWICEQREKTRRYKIGWLQKTARGKIGLIYSIICYVEYGTNFLCEFSHMYEQYHIDLESVFDNGTKLMKQFFDHEVENFVERLRVVVKKADCMGWRYYDAISEMSHQAYPLDSC